MDSTLDSGATPTMPLPPPSCPCPAISEAIQVPCTPQLGLPGGVCTPVRSGPVLTEPARSGTSGLTPLSITATVAPCPLVTDQAEGALIASSTHIWASRTVSAPAGRAAAAPAAISRASMSSPAAARRGI